MIEAEKKTGPLPEIAVIAGLNDAYRGLEELTGAAPDEIQRRLIEYGFRAALQYLALVEREAQKKKAQSLILPGGLQC